MKVYVPVSKEDGEYLFTYKTKKEALKATKHFLYNDVQWDIKEFDIPKYSCGSLMPAKQWLEEVKAGCLIDYDGFGKVLDDNFNEVKTIRPSNAKEIGDYNWVLWFNR